MNYKRVFIQFVLVLLTGFAAAGTFPSPSDNPNGFRNSLHPDPAPAKTYTGPAVPAIISGTATPALKANFDDLAVSETVSPANFTQDKSDIVRLKGGRMVAVWEDNRLGPVAIAAQLFHNDGSLIGGNAVLILGDSYNVTDPKICADTLGNFFIVWREDARGQLQAARFDSLAHIITPVFFVSDTLALSYTGAFGADCTPDGRLAATWEDYAAGNTIALRLFSIAGIPLTGTLTVNSDSPANKHWSPKVAVGSNNDLMVVWEDYRNSNIADIFGRRFNIAGTPYATEASLSDVAARNFARYLPSITFGSTDGYTVGWVDLRSGQNIYLQRLDASGTAIAANVLLTTESNTFPNWEIDLSTSSAGFLVAAWTVYGDHDIIDLQLFDAGMVKAGGAITVSTATLQQRFRPAVCGNRGGNVGVVWTDLLSGSPDIYGAVFNNAGAVQKAAFLVNDDTAGNPATEPVVTAVSRYDWLAVFSDQRRDAGDIMVQQIYVGGTLVGTNRRINADVPGGTQNQPAAASNIDKICISWTDVRSDGIHGQNILCRFSRPTFDITDEILVNDDGSGSAAHYASDCAVSTQGKSLVVWTDTRGGNAKIYGQLFDLSNAKSGANMQIGPSQANRTGEAVKAVADSSGNFIVAYLDRLNPSGPAIAVKKVSSTGVLSDAFSFVSDNPDYEIDGFDLGVNATGSIYIVWHGFGATQNDLFLTVFNATGGIVAATRSLVDNASANPGVGAMAIDPEGYLLVTWLDSRTGSRTPFHAVLDPSLTPLGNNTPDYTVAGSFMQQPAVSALRGRGIFVWSDARANGLKVYASQEIYSPTAADDGGSALPSTYTLEQNVPNPFNPTTTIHFTLAKAGQTRLEIFNIAGQRLRVLADGNFSAGNHSVVWDGTGDDGSKAATGIYFYRLKSGEFDRTQKMVLLK